MSETIEAPTAPAVVEWTVFDRNARSGPRIHDAPSGVSYSLQAAVGAKMPPADAAVFLRDPAFRVFDEAGRERVPLPDAENLDALKARPDLEPDETIARYEELLDSALQARVAIRPGGHELAGADREALIDFLETAPTVAELAPAARARRTGFQDADEMSEKELDRLMPKGPMPDTGSRAPRAPRPPRAPRAPAPAAPAGDPLAMGG